MIDNSYYIILNRLKAFANGHYLINTFTYHEIANFDITKNPHYPIMHVVPVSMNPTKGAIDYSFNITFADWVRAKEEKQENEVTVISDLHRCALDLCAEITNGNILFGDEVSINGDAVIEPFIDEFANVLSGVTLQITIRVPYNWSACDIPANWVEGTGDIPDFGGRSLTMDIYDEGNFVVAAREMNFVGSGVTVTYTGNRAIVTINGGGGGGSVEGVTGNIVNNTDPANPVVTQVQPDWNAGSGLGQILNKPSIPSAQVNSDWNATSGVSEILNKPSLTGFGDMFKSVYDTDNDGIVDKAETVQIIVRNSTGSTLTKGQVVYLSGATGNRPNAVLAQADSEATSSKTIGIVVANIANNSDGNIAVNGTLHDLNTNSFTDGDAVWLSATTAGGITATPPAEPNHTVFIGYIARAHPTQGRIVLAIQNGYELNELHGVSVPSPSTNDVLYYASDGLWKNKALAKSDVGLGSVDNTSDLNKPISTATQTALTQITPAKSRFAVIENDFMAALTVYDQLLAAATVSGTQAGVTGTLNHPGIVAFLDSASANGGFSVITNNNMLLLGGGEKATFVFQDRNTTTRATAFIRLGFSDSSTSTAPTDGVYAQISGGVLTGICRNNNTQSVTASTIAVTENTWYSLTVEVVSTSLVTFTLYSEAGVVLWTDNVTTNIPSTTGRETGFGATVYETTTSAAAQILWVDYLRLEINRTLVR